MSWYGVFCWCCVVSLLVSSMWTTGDVAPLTILSIAFIVSYNLRAMLGGDNG
jgi:hypothetical protein